MLMVQADYANYRGVSRASVGAAIKRGVLDGATVTSPTGRVMIDSDKADEIWNPIPRNTANIAGMDDKIRSAVSEAISETLRDLLVSLPGKLSSQLANLSDPVQIESLIRIELLAALGEAQAATD